MASTRTVKLIAKLQDGISGGLRNLTRAGTMAVGAIAAVGAAAFVAAKKLSDYGASIYDLSSATGVSIEDTQALGYAFEQTGGSASSMGGAIRGLNTFMRTAATGGAEYMNVLNDLGLSYDELRMMTPTNAFLTLTDAIGGLGDEMERNIAATTVFGGRYAQQIVGALDQADGSLRNLTESFAESGRAMSTDQITSLKAYSDAMTDLDYEMKKLLADALVPMLPAMKNMTGELSTAARDILPSLIPLVERMVNVMIDNLPTVVRLLGTVADGWDRINSTMQNGLGGGEAEQLQRALTDAVRSGAITVEQATAEWEQYTRTGRSWIQTAEGMVNPVAMAVNSINDLTSAHGILRNQQITVSSEFDNTARAAFAAAAAIDTVTQSSSAATPVAVGQANAMMGLAIAYNNFINPAVEAEETPAATIGAAGVEAGKLELTLKQILENTKEYVKELRGAKDLMKQESELEIARRDNAIERKVAEAEADAARQAALEQSSATAGKFAMSMITAASTSGEAWDGFWNNFRAQIIQTVGMKAFTTLLNFVPGLGGVLGFLGFTGGTPSVPQYKAAGGMVVPGSTGAQGDSVPMLLQPGERVISKQGVNQMARGNSGDVYVTVPFQPAFSSANPADAAKMASTIEKILRESNVINRLASYG